MTKKPSFTISQLAEEFGITTRTIRFYEEKGLLSPRRNGQARIYSAADRTKLKLILRGKRLGLSLHESLDLIEMYQPDHDNSDQLKQLIAKINEKRELLKQQFEDLNTMMRDLDEAEARCVDALKANSPSK